MTIIVHITKFLLGLVLVYIVAILLLSNISVGEKTILQLITHNYNSAGTDLGQSVVRFREIKNFKNVDIVFLGSSHSYRGFDPRIFQKYNLKSFNLGTTAQTPLNSYYLLKCFMRVLKPKLIIYEIYFGALVSEDGLESYYDLLNNTGFTFELFQMALATGNLNAFNAMVSTYLGRINKPLTSIKVREFKNETYIPGGYCEVKRKNRVKSIEEFDEFVLQHFGKIAKVRISDIQINYLRNLIRFVKQQNVNIVLVTHPFPKELLERISNYDEISQYFEEFADNHDIEYFDFNDYMVLDTYNHFKDEHHVNADGVRIFNEALIDTLFNRGIIDFTERFVGNGKKTGH